MTWSPFLERWEALGRPLPHLPRWGAATLLAALLGALVWSIAEQSTLDRLEVARTGPTTTIRGDPIDQRGDLALYERISARVAAGEGYYAVAIDEQRRAGYPTRPFVTVRLPTLAFLHTLIGPAGVRYVQIVLLIACLAALPGAVAGMASRAEQLAAMAALLLGGATSFAPLAGLYHEAMAGVLLTLALLLYRAARWWPTLLAAGAALAVRELAVPFVLLWLVIALSDRRWREAVGVAGLLVLFALGMALHGLAVERANLPTDLVSEPWDAMEGYVLPLMVMSRLTMLAVLPPVLAAPLAILPLVGWLGLGGRLGLVACLWCAGVFTMTALFARPENFYWVQLVLPAYAIGIVFSPRALAELVHRAGKR